MKYNLIILNNIRKIALIFHAFYDNNGNIEKVEENLPILKSSIDWLNFKSIYLEKFNQKIKNNSFSYIKDKYILSQLEEDFSICKLKNSASAFISFDFSKEYYDFREDSSPSVFFDISEDNSFIIKSLGIIMIPIYVKDIEGETLEEKFEYQEVENLFEFYIDDNFAKKHHLYESDFSYPDLLTLIYNTINWK